MDNKDINTQTLINQDETNACDEARSDKDAVDCNNRTDCNSENFITNEGNKDVSENLEMQSDVENDDVGEESDNKNSLISDEIAKDENKENMNGENIINSVGEDKATRSDVDVSGSLAIDPDTEKNKNADFEEFKKALDTKNAELLNSDVSESAAEVKKEVDLKKESARVFGMSERQLEKEFNAFKFKKLVSHIDYELTDPLITTEELKKKLSDAKSYGFNSAVVLPNKLDGIRKSNRNGVKICAVIGYPLGESTAKVKVCEMKQAIWHGAQELEVVFSISLLKDKKLRTIAFNLAKFRRVAGKRYLKIDLDTSNLTAVETDEALKLIIESKADMVRLSMNNYGEISLPVMANAVAKCAGKCRLEIAGALLDCNDAAEALKTGADRIAAPNAVEIAVKMRSNLELDD